MYSSFDGTNGQSLMYNNFSCGFGSKDEFNSKQIFDTMNANNVISTIFMNSSPNSSSEVSPPINRKKKKPCPVPDEKKDNAYKIRREKNNSSAKKSREIRRQREHEKEVQIANLQRQVAYLSQQVVAFQAYYNQFTNNSNLNSSMISNNSANSTLTQPNLSVPFDNSQFYSPN